MHTYASLLAAIVGGSTVTYGALARGERMHVQSMRRDDLVAVRDSSGALVESLMGDGQVKDTWTVVATVRGREVAQALAPFATGAPVVGKAPKVEGKPRHAAPTGETCGAITRKGTPCGARISARTGACSLVPAHGGPVTSTRVERDPAPTVGIVSSTVDGQALGRVDADALLGALTALLTNAGALR